MSMHFGRKGRLSFNPEHVKDLGWVPNNWKYKFNSDHAKDIVGMAQNMLRDLIQWNWGPETSKVVKSAVQHPKHSKENIQLSNFSICL